MYDLALGNLLLQDRAAEEQLDLQKAAVASIGANEALAGRWRTLGRQCAEAREGGRRLRRAGGWTGAARPSGERAFGASRWARLWREWVNGMLARVGERDAGARNGERAARGVVDGRFAWPGTEVDACERERARERNGALRLGLLGWVRVAVCSPPSRPGPSGAGCAGSLDWGCSPLGGWVLARKQARPKPRRILWPFKLLT